MKTAETVQLLDANNVNISPAVCIDSLYYEGTKDNDTYRFSLRKKLIVGGNLVSNVDTLLSVSDEGVFIPYVYAELGLDNVWKLSSSSVNISDQLNEYIDLKCADTYVTNSSCASNYLNINGSNHMKGSVKLDSGNTHKLSLTSSGLETPNANNYVSLSNNRVTLQSDASVTAIAPDIRIGTVSGNKVTIGNTSGDLYMSGKRSTLVANSSVTLISNENDVSIYAYQDINGSASNVKLNGSESIRLITPHLYFRDKEFPVPGSDSYSRVLSANNNGKMSWEKTGALKINNFSSHNSSKTISYVNQSEVTVATVKFAGDNTKYALIGNSDMTVNVKSINSASDVRSLSGSGAVYVKTINNQSMISDGPANLSLVAQSVFDSMTKVNWGNDNYGKIGCVNLTGNTININQTNVTVDNYGNVSATSFLMTSDRNKKTDVREDCFNREMPAIHGFKWKDSSLQSYGFIAQELEEAGFHELVHEQEDGHKSVDYIAALSYKVARLEEENRRLWDAIEELRKKV